MLKRYLIVADDFTGANDTGVQMKRRGLDTLVVFAGKKIPDDSWKEGSVVIDTESRGLSSEEAERRVADAVSEIDFSAYAHVIKKVDSTLRGNVAEEVKALDSALGSELVIFAPALPDLNRTTENCVHRLNGVPISQTEIAMDPKKPVLEDDIQKILQKVYDEPVEYISLDEIREGKIDLSEGRIFACDATRNSDLRAVIKAAICTGKRVLWVGSAAVADNIMELENPTSPALGVIASVSAVTGGQIHKAEDFGVSLVKVPVHDILLNKRDIAEYIDEAAAFLRAGKDTIICSSSSYNRSEMDLSTQAGKELGMELSEVSDFVQKLMGSAAREIISSVSVSGVFVTGGDTAMGLLESLDAEGSVILSEIAVGIPMMKLMGGCMDGLKVVTKAGAFGNDDALLFAFRKLRDK